MLGLSCDWRMCLNSRFHLNRSTEVYVVCNMNRSQKAINVYCAASRGYILTSRLVKNDLRVNHNNISCQRLI